MITEKQFALKMEKIILGKKIWDKLMIKFEIRDNDAVILFPHTKEEINKVGSRLLSLYIRKRNPRKVLILFAEGSKLEFIDQVNVTYFPMGFQQVSYLMTYYSLCDMGHNFIVMSLIKPYGRFGEKVIERNNISLREVVAYGIYGLSREEAGSEEINNN